MSSAINHLYILAANIHSGGGLNLLISVLTAIPANQTVTLFIDSRAALPDALSKHLDIHRVEPSVYARLQIERLLKSIVQPEDDVLCFGNLPPVFKLLGRVTVFVQNRHLIESTSLAGFNWKTKLRLQIERIWLKKFIRDYMRFVVQTNTMHRLLSSNFLISSNRVCVVPFLSKNNNLSLKKSGSVDFSSNFKFDFIYPASGDPHKNHRRLFEAWCLLAQNKLYPHLLVTIDDSIYPDLSSDLELMTKQYSLNITNLGYLSSDALDQSYRQSRALLYPSLVESFGVPLLEAKAIGLPILAGELDYVRDLIAPVETFDPASAYSIYRAVRRFLTCAEPVHKIKTAPDFLMTVLNTR